MIIPICDPRHHLGTHPGGGGFWLTGLCDAADGLNLVSTVYEAAEDLLYAFHELIIEFIPVSALRLLCKMIRELVNDALQTYTRSVHS